MPYVGKNPDLNASVDTNELADDAVTLGKIGEDVKTAISGSFVAKADKSAISGSIVSGVSGSATSTGSFGSVHTAGNVCIGTTTPLSQAGRIGLTISGTAGGALWLRDNADTDSWKIEGSDSVLNIGIDTDDDGAANSQYVKIESDGKFQLGSALQFKEVYRNTSISVDNSSGVNLRDWTTDGSGNVGYLVIAFQTGDDRGVVAHCGRHGGSGSYVAYVKQQGTDNVSVGSQYVTFKTGGGTHTYSIVAYRVY